MKFPFKDARIILIALTISLAIVLAGYFLLYPFIYQTPSKSPLTVTVQGYVYPDEDILKSYENNQESYLEDRVNLIVVYDAPNYLERPCEAEILAKAPITWHNDTFGEYLRTFETSFPKDIFISTSCSFGEIKLHTIDESDSKVSFNVTWTRKAISQGSSRLRDTPEKVLKTLENTMSNLNYKIENSEISESSKKDVREDFSRALDYERMAREETNRESKYANALTSEWSVQQVFFKISYYKLQSCVEDFNQTIEEHSNNLCFLQDLDSIEKLNESGKALEIYSDNLDDNILRIQQPGDLRGEITGLENTRRAIDQKLSNCEDALSIQNKSFNFQNQFCEDRKLVLNLFQFSSTIILLLIGIFAGILIEWKFRIIRRSKIKLQNTEQNTSLWWNKQKTTDKILVGIGIITAALFYFILIFAIDILPIYTVGLALEFTGFLLKLYYDKSRPSTIGKKKRK